MVEIFVKRYAPEYIHESMLLENPYPWTTMTPQGKIPPENVCGKPETERTNTEGEMPLETSCM